jgi:hypothetical protein
VPVLADLEQCVFTDDFNELAAGSSSSPMRGYAVSSPDGTQRKGGHYTEFGVGSGGEGSGGRAGDISRFPVGRQRPNLPPGLQAKAQAQAQAQAHKEKGQPKALWTIVPSTQLQLQRQLQRDRSQEPCLPSWLAARRWMGKHLQDLRLVIQR